MEIKELVPDLDISKWIEQYLKVYGIKDIQEYLYPTFKYVESPNVYDGMEEGYNLIINTLNKEGNIGFIQDCDVDGICSCACLYKYLLNLLPDEEQKRLKIYFHSDKKHGITENAVFWAIENQISLLIVPDAGSNDYVQHMDLNFLNIDVLIIDHHVIEPRPKYMQEYKSNYKTVIISNQKGWVKNKALSGTGVVTKFLKYIDEKENMKCSAKYADLVALSLVSDSCDMTSQENRDFFLFGTNKINNPFLSYLAENMIWKKDDDGEIILNQYTFGFNICPYLNAVCRGNNQQLKKELFYAFVGYVYKRIESGEIYIETFVPYNSIEEYEPLLERLKEEKAYQDKMVDKTLQNGQICLVRSCSDIPVLGIMTLTDPDSFSYTGLIANKLKREYECSIFVIHESKDINKYTGSCRADINTLELCQKSSLFELASGHEAAHGIIFQKDKLENIKEYFQKECINQEKFKIPVVKTYMLSMDDIPKSLFGFADEWDFLWNNKFVKPVFNIDSICINSKDIQTMGKDKNTIKFKKDGIEFIKFKVTEDEKAELFLNEDKDLVLNTICNLTTNEWHGRITLQAVIEIMEINYEIKEEDSKPLTWEDVFG